MGSGQRTEVHPDDVEQLVDPVLPLPALGQVVDVKRLTDDVAHRLPRVERRIRVLEDHRHLAAPRPQRPALKLGDVLTLELNRAIGWLVKAHNGPA